MITTKCEYCRSVDGGVSKYHPNTCAHCGAEVLVETVYGYFFGKPITNINTYHKILKSDFVGSLYSGALFNMAKSR